MNKKELSKIRKKARVDGKKHELQVRKDLESKDWIISKWQNNVEFLDAEFKIGRIIPCKPKFNPFTKSLMMNSGGFPDFIAYKLGLYSKGVSAYNIIGVESKSNGILTKEEREKCRWLISNNIFSKILIAIKGEKRGSIIYKEFENEH